MLVLGLGDTGLSMAKWLAGRGARLRVADSRAQPPGAGALRTAVPCAELHLGAWRNDSFQGVDLIAISPGVPRDTAQVRRAMAAGIPVMGDVELFARALPKHERPRILAITGTNGKSTVTALTGVLCRAAGMDAEVAGNISPAVLDALAARESAGVAAAAWVLELSSFQLESTDTLAADAATMLNLSEDHLDRYAGMAEYAAAKQRIFRGAGAQVLNRDAAASMAMAAPGRRILTFGTDAPRGADDFGLVEEAGALWLSQGRNRLIRADSLRIAGLHNAANALAALALCRAAGLRLAGAAAAPLFAALSAFRGLPHRVELVGERDGVRYYDDSKGTNVGSTVAALAGLSAGGAKVVLIAGGDGKGQDFSPLKPAVKKAARAVVLIGRDAGLIEQAIAGTGVEVARVASGNDAAQVMVEALHKCAAHARPGDAVLLSPACASFDMFSNYKQRGEVFRDAVEALVNA